MSTNPLQGVASRRREEMWNVISMSIPIVVATCCRMVMDVTDYWMISRGDDSDAQAAILPAQMIIWTYTVIGMGTVTIITTMVSQSLGRGDLRRCSAYAWQSLYLSIGFGVLGMALWWILPQVFHLAGHEAAIQEKEIRYAQIAVWTIGPTILAMGLSSFFNGVHRPRITMIVALEGVVVNAVMSYVLIFGVWGFPAMGIAGAAWGTVIGTVYRAVRLVVALCTHKINETYHSRSTWRFDRVKTLNILRVGGPSGLQWCSDMAVWAIFTVVLIGTTFGKEHQLATNAAWQYLRISFMPCMGVATAVSSIVGKAIGARDIGRALRAARLGAMITLAYMGLMSVVYLVGRNELIGFFTDDPRVIAIGAGVMICTAIFQVFDALGVTYNFALRAAGDTFVPSIVFVLGHWIIVVGGGFAVAAVFPQLGSIGPWIAASALIVLTGLWLWLRWRGQRWVHIDVFKHDRPTTDAPVEVLKPTQEPIGEAVA